MVDDGEMVDDREIVEDDKMVRIKNGDQSQTILNHKETTINVIGGNSLFTIKFLDR